MGDTDKIYWCNVENVEGFSISAMLHTSWGIHFIRYDLNISRNAGRYIVPPISFGIFYHLFLCRLLWPLLELEIVHSS